MHTVIIQIEVGFFPLVSGSQGCQVLLSPGGHCVMEFDAWWMYATNDSQRSKRVEFHRVQDDRQKGFRD
jgi:hypothetical protein